MKIPFAYLEDDYIDDLKETIKELEDLLVMQTSTISEKDKLIDELMKENKAFKEAIQKWKDESNKTYWG